MMSVRKLFKISSVISFSALLSVLSVLSVSAVGNPFTPLVNVLRNLANAFVDLFFQSPKSVLLVFLLFVFWLIFYGFFVIALRKYYKGEDLPKEAKIIAASLAIVIVLGFFFFTGTENLANPSSFTTDQVLSRMGSVLATFFSVGSVIASILVYIMLNETLSSFGYEKTKTRSTIAAVIAIITFLGLLGLGVSVSDQGETGGTGLLQALAVPLLIFFVLMLLFSVTVKYSHKLAQSDTKILSSLGEKAHNFWYETEAKKFAEKRSLEKGMNQLEKLSRKEIKNFNKFKALESEKNESIRLIPQEWESDEKGIKYVEDVLKPGKGIDRIIKNQIDFLNDSLNDLGEEIDLIETIATYFHPGQKLLSEIKKIRGAQLRVDQLKGDIKEIIVSIRTRINDILSSLNNQKTRLSEEYGGGGEIDVVKSIDLIFGESSRKIETDIKLLDIDIGKLIKELKTVSEIVEEAEEVQSQVELEELTEKKAEQDYRQAIIAIKNVSVKASVLRRKSYEEKIRIFSASDMTDPLIEDSDKVIVDSAFNKLFDFAKLSVEILKSKYSDISEEYILEFGKSAMRLRAYLERIASFSQIKDKSAVNSKIQYLEIIEATVGSIVQIYNPERRAERFATLKIKISELFFTQFGMISEEEGVKSKVDIINNTIERKNQVVEKLKRASASEVEDAIRDAKIFEEQISDLEEESPLLKANLEKIKKELEEELGKREAEVSKSKSSAKSKKPFQVPEKYAQEFEKYIDYGKELVQRLKDKRVLGDNLESVLRGGNALFEKFSKFAEDSKLDYIKAEYENTRNNIILAVDEKLAYTISIKSYDDTKVLWDFVVKNGLQNLIKTTDTFAGGKGTVEVQELFSKDVKHQLSYIRNQIDSANKSLKIADDEKSIKDAFSKYALVIQEFFVLEKMPKMHPDEARSIMKEREDAEREIAKSLKSKYDDSDEFVQSIFNSVIEWAESSDLFTSYIAGLYFKHYFKR